jgi:hypothetical protein
MTTNKSAAHPFDTRMPETTADKLAAHLFDARIDQDNNEEVYLPPIRTARSKETAAGWVNFNGVDIEQHEDTQNLCQICTCPCGKTSRHARYQSQKINEGN